MGIRKLSFTVSQEMSNTRLDQFLTIVIPPVLGEPLSKGKIRKLIIAGAVYLNRNRVRIASKTLQANSQVETYIDLVKLKSDEASTKDRSFKMSENRILFEDEFLIAIDKPAGLPTQPTIDEARNNLYEIVKNFLSKRDNINEAYLGIHQRLDRDTSGVILFTKNPLANKGLAEAFASHQVVKVYQTIVNCSKKDLPKSPWSIKNYLGRVRANKGKQAKYKSVIEGGDFAHTDFSILDIYESLVLLEARPKTGRTHQIRVHLAEEGMPIVGDTLYNGKTGKTIARTMLHAKELTFTHPISKQKVTIISNLPEDFKKCLFAGTKSQISPSF